MRALKEYFLAGSQSISLVSFLPCLFSSTPGPQLTAFWMIQSGVQNHFFPAGRGRRPRRFEFRVNGFRGVAERRFSTKQRCRVVSHYYVPPSLS